jgi:hypothetical protein
MGETILELILKRTPRARYLTTAAKPIGLTTGNPASRLLNN